MQPSEGLMLEVPRYLPPVFGLPQVGHLYWPVTCPLGIQYHLKLA